jgi:RNA polymerase sigma-70 factor (ECF subfamily)
VTDEARLKALMLRGLGGEAVAHRELLAVMAGLLRGYFGRRLSDGAADLEDLVQDTLLAIHLRRETYDTAQPFTPWAYAVARYKLMDHFRRRGVRRTVPLEDAGELIAVETAESGAVRRDLDKLLMTLPDRQRTLVMDVRITGLSMEEAATKAGMTVTAVKVSVHRALKLLSKRVSDENR